MRPQAPPASAALGRVLQNARLEIDEAGTSAAGSGTLLFAGVVDDPTQEETD